MTSHTQHCTSVSCKGCVLILHRALQTSIRMLHQCVVINGYVKNTTTTGYFLFWVFLSITEVKTYKETKCSKAPEQFTPTTICTSLFLTFDSFHTFSPSW